MKSYNVDDKMKDPEVIKRGLIKVCKSKKKKKIGKNRKYKQAQVILKDPDKYTDMILNIVLATEIVMKREMQGVFIKDEMWEMSFNPKKCESFRVKDGPSQKEREITSVPLAPDQFIHQLLIEAAEPVFMKGMYEYSCGSIPGRGAHKAQKYIKKYIKRHNKHDKSAIKYGSQLDITKCYQSFSHTCMKNQLRRKFRGRLFLYIMFKVIDSYVHTEIKGERYGLPIGYSTSQWLCNFGLTPVDHYIKCELRVEFYIRYVDDMIMFGRNKKELHKNVKLISEFIKGAGLQLKPNWQVFRYDYIDRNGKRRGRAFDTLGLRFFRDKTILRKRNALAIKRQVQRVYKSKRINVYDARSLMSRLGQIRHCNSYNFYMKHIKPYVKIRKLKEVIRVESRKHSKANKPI